MNRSATDPQQESFQFLGAFLIAIALMVTDHYGNYLNSVRSIILTSLSPLEALVQTPVAAYKHFAKDYSSFDDLQLENQQLKAEILILKSKQQQLITLQQEVKRLENLLGTTGKLANQSIQIGTVSYLSDTPVSQFISIDKGSLDGVKPQQTVIDEFGILGQIVLTSPNFSRALLITDPEHQIPVRVQRTSQRGILKGQGLDQASLNFIPKNSDIKAGDILESSGLGGVFPEGYPVAKVTSVQDLQESPYATISVMPISNIREVNKILILENKSPRYRPKIFRQEMEQESSEVNTMETVSQ